MAKFCTSCGKEIAEGIAFCTECGTPAPKEPAAAQMPDKEPAAAAHTAADEAPAAQPAAQPVYQEPAPQPAPVPAPAPSPAAQTDVSPKGGKYGVAGTGAYFGLMFLFAIPVIGWLICIIMACAAKNRNLRHFAKATLIWLIIGIVLCAAAYLVFRWMSGSIIEYINRATGEDFGSWADIIGQFKNGGLGAGEIN